MGVSVDDRAVSAGGVVGALANIAAHEHGDRAEKMIGVLFVNGSLDVLFQSRILQSSLQADADSAYAAFQQRSHRSENLRALRMLVARSVEANDIGVADHPVEDRTDLLLAVKISFVSLAHDQADLRASQFCEYVGGDGRRPAQQLDLLQKTGEIGKTELRSPL